MTVTIWMRYSLPQIQIPWKAEEEIDMSKLRESRRYADLKEVGEGAGSTTASVMFGPEYKRSRFQVFVSVTLPADREDLLSGRALTVAGELAEQAATEAIDRIAPKFVAFVDGEESEGNPWG